MAWWSSSEVQEVRGKFCHQFARTSDEWLSQWKEELIKTVGGQKNRSHKSFSEACQSNLKTITIQSTL